MQNAWASNQLTQLMGKLSVPGVPAESVQVCWVEIHFSAALSAVASAGKLGLALHAESQPGSLGLFGLFPAPGLVMFCAYAAMKFRKRPTVISYVSSRKLLMVAG